METSNRLTSCVFMSSRTALEPKKKWFTHFSDKDEGSKSSLLTSFPLWLDLKLSESETQSRHVRWCQQRVFLASVFVWKSALGVYLLPSEAKEHNTVSIWAELCVLQPYLRLQVNCNCGICSGFRTPPGFWDPLCFSTERRTDAWMNTSTSGEVWDLRMRSQNSLESWEPSKLQQDYLRCQCGIVRICPSPLGGVLSLPKWHPLLLPTLQLITKWTKWHPTGWSQGARLGTRRTTSCQT